MNRDSKALNSDLDGSGDLVQNRGDLMDVATQKEEYIMSLKERYAAMTDLPSEDDFALLGEFDAVQPDNESRYDEVESRPSNEDAIAWGKEICQASAHAF